MISVKLGSSRLLSVHQYEEVTQLVVHFLDNGSYNILLNFELVRIGFRFHCNEPCKVGEELNMILIIPNFKNIYRLEPQKV